MGWGMNPGVHLKTCSLFCNSQYFPLILNLLKVACLFTIWIKTAYYAFPLAIKMFPSYCARNIKMLHVSATKIGLATSPWTTNSCVYRNGCAITWICLSLVYLTLNHIVSDVSKLPCSFHLKQTFVYIHGFTLKCILMFWSWLWLWRTLQFKS